MGKQKAIGQAMLQVNQILKPLRKYGMNEYIDSGALPLLKNLLEQVYDRGNGKDVIIQIDTRKIKW